MCKLIAFCVGLSASLLATAATLTQPIPVNGAGDLLTTSPFPPLLTMQFGGSLGTDFVTVVVTNQPCETFPDMCLVQGSFGFDGMGYTLAQFNLSGDSPSTTFFGTTDQFIPLDAVVTFGPQPSPNVQPFTIAPVPEPSGRLYAIIGIAAILISPIGRSLQTINTRDSKSMSLSKWVGRIDPV